MRISVRSYYQKNVNEQIEKINGMRNETCEGLINSVDQLRHEISLQFFGKYFRSGAMSLFLTSMTLQDIYNDAEKKEKGNAGFGIDLVMSVVL